MFHYYDLRWLGLKKAGSHAQISLPLKEKREVKANSTEDTNFEGKYYIILKNVKRSYI